MSTSLRIAGACLGCALLLAAGRAAEQEDADAKLFEKVMKRMLSTDLVKRSYPTKFAWPPKYLVKPSSAREINAAAPNPCSMA